MLPRQRPASGCGFCRRNRESLEIVNSHELRDRRGRVQCPQLRKHRCEGCGATGDEAHTRSYCPNVVSLRTQSERNRRRSPDSGVSTSSSSLTSSQEAGLTIDLGSNRAFYNMSSVTNSRYNSAGELRDRAHRGRQAHAGGVYTCRARQCDLPDWSDNFNHNFGRANGYSSGHSHRTYHNNLNMSGRSRDAGRNGSRDDFAGRSLE